MQAGTSLNHPERLKIPALARPKDVLLELSPGPTSMQR